MHYVITMRSFFAYLRKYLGGIPTKVRKQEPTKLCPVGSCVLCGGGNLGGRQLRAATGAVVIASSSSCLACPTFQIREDAGPTNDTAVCQRAKKCPVRFHGRRIRLTRLSGLSSLRWSRRHRRHAVSRRSILSINIYSVRL